LDFSFKISLRPQRHIITNNSNIIIRSNYTKRLLRLSTGVCLNDWRNYSRNYLPPWKTREDIMKKPTQHTYHRDKLQRYPLRCHFPNFNIVQVTCIQNKCWILYGRREAIILRVKITAIPFSIAWSDLYIRVWFI